MADQNDTTLYPEGTEAGGSSRQALGLTIALHPELGRIGEIAPLFDLGRDGSAELSRATPVFRSVNGRSRSSLDSPLLSRSPLRISLRGDALHIEHDGRMELRVDGVPLTSTLVLPVGAAARGIVLELGKTVVLLLHPVAFATDEHPVAFATDLQSDFGLLGDSQAIRGLRARIAQVAAASTPVLLRGETGSGKELVARAIHRASSRAGKPYVTVNMAAVPPSVAESELFGHRKGAFTGADVDRKGLFEQAHGGTLFLDEVGEAAPEIQVKLLRALDTGEIQPVGGKPLVVDFRLLSATDADLEQAVLAGRFKRPLLERLRGYTLHVPPLRERRDDVARLFGIFLRAELAASGATKRLAKPPEDAQSFLPTRLMTRLLLHSWPGNVRELRKVVQHLLIANADNERFELDAVLEQQLDKVPGAASTTSTSDPPPAMPLASSAPTSPRRRPAELTDAEILEALRRHAFNQSRTCAELDVSRSWLNTRLDHCEGVRKPKDVSEAEIRAAHERCRGDLERMAEALEISPRGLQLRMGQLDIA